MLKHLFLAHFVGYLDIMCVLKRLKGPKMHRNDSAKCPGSDQKWHKDWLQSSLQRNKTVQKCQTAFLLQLGLSTNYLLGLQIADSVRNEGTISKPV